MSDIDLNSMQATAKVTGKVIEVGKKEAAGRSEKQIVVVTFQDGRYTNDVALEFFGVNVEKCADIKAGDRIRVTYSSRSRKAKDGDRWFNSNDAWDVEILAAPASRPAPRRDEPPPRDDNDRHGYDDDLPL
jgi:hypothetical protein